MGTLFALMLPYAVIFLLFWMILLGAALLLWREKAATG